MKANSQECSYQVFNIAQDEEDQPIGVVRTLKPITIPAWSEGFIKVKIPKSIVRNKEFLFTSAGIESYEDLQLLESASRAHETNCGVKYSWVKYRNFSTYSYEIPKGYIIGEAS